MQFQRGKFLTTAHITKRLLKLFYCKSNCWNSSSQNWMWMWINFAWRKHLCFEAEIFNSPEHKFDNLALPSLRDFAVVDVEKVVHRGILQTGGWIHYNIRALLLGKSNIIADIEAEMTLHCIPFGVWILSPLKNFLCDEDNHLFLWSMINIRALQCFSHSNQ